MSESGSIADHLNDFNIVTSQLSSVGVNFDDEDRALLFLCSLPESLNGLVMAISNSVSGSTTLKFDDVVGAILTEEMRWKSSGETLGNSLSAESRGRKMERGKSSGYRSKSRKGRSKSRSGIVCCKCGKKGHLKKYCRSWKGKEGDAKQENNHETNVTDDVLQDALILSFENIIDSWVVDLGASLHATPDKKYFHDYVQGDFGQVRLGDDKPCKIVGMEAMQVESRKKWELAMEEEMDSLMHNQTWDLVRLLVGKTKLQNKWVYKLKEEDGGKERYKARLVVKGFAQKKGIDFNQIFSPVAKMTSIRTILSLVAVEYLHLEQLDFKTTFLHGVLEEENICSNHKDMR
eukprot:PITA_05819